MSEPDPPAVGEAPPFTAGRGMPTCVCGHAWAVHIIPGGVDNLDVYPHERHCEDCGCRGYMMQWCSDCPPVGYPTDDTRCAVCPRRA